MNLELVLIILLIWAIYYQYIKITKLILKQQQNLESSQKIDNEINKENLKYNILKDEIEFRKMLKTESETVINDPLVPGKRRLPSHQIPRKIFKDKINIPTRGQPDNFQYLGNLVRDTDDKILPVFGRQEFPGSNYYEYYLMLNQDGNFGLKLPLNSGKRMREIEENEIVKVDYFKSTTGDFKFKPFDYDILRYNPYDY